MLLRGRGVGHTIPERCDQRQRRMERPGRQPSFDATTYARRNMAERCLNRLKQSPCPSHHFTAVTVSVGTAVHGERNCVACWALWRVLQAARPASLAPSSRACSFMLPKATGTPARCPRRTEPSRRGEK